MLIKTNEKIMTADTRVVNRILDILKPMGDIVTQEEPCHYSRKA